MKEGGMDTGPYAPFGREGRGPGKRKDRASD